MAEKVWTDLKLMPVPSAAPLQAMAKVVTLVVLRPLGQGMRAVANTPAPAACQTGVQSLAPLLAL